MQKVKDAQPDWSSLEMVPPVIQSHSVTLIVRRTKFPLKYYCKSLTFAKGQFSTNGLSGPQCLTMPLWRKLGRGRSHATEHALQAELGDGSGEQWQGESGPLDYKLLPPLGHSNMHCQQTAFCRVALPYQFGTLLANVFGYHWSSCHKIAGSTYLEGKQQPQNRTVHSAQPKRTWTATEEILLMRLDFYNRQ